VKATTDWKKHLPSSLRGALEPRDLVLAVCGGILLWAPLAYGSVHPWAYVSLGLALAILSTILLARVGLAPFFARDSLGTLPRPPLWGLVLAAALLVLFQLVPLPQGVVGWLSPQAIQIRSLGNAYGLGPLIPLSLNSNATIRETLLLWPAAVLFFVLVYTVNSRRRIEALVFLLLGWLSSRPSMASGIFKATSSGAGRPFYPGRLCGTFINSNHAAGYLGMAILLACGLFLARERRDGATAGDRRDHNWLRFWSRAEHLEPLVRRALFFLPLLMLLVAFFFAASRGAILALGFGLALMGFLWASQHSERWPLYLLTAFLVGVALYSLWLGGATVFAWVMNLSDQGRDIAFWGSLHLIREFPLVGAGLGTFDDLPYGFVPVTLSRTRLTYNDWVELLAETGLVAFIIGAGGWCLFMAI